MTRTAWKLPSDPPKLPLILDTRDHYEPAPDSPLRTDFAGIIREGLDTGDLSIVGLSHLVRIEAKWELSDLIGCVTGERERFSREVRRLIGFPHRLLVIGATLGEIEMGQYRSKVSPESVLGSLSAWASDGLPFILAGSRAKAEREAARFLRVVVRRRWRELRAMAVNEQTEFIEQGGEK